MELLKKVSERLEKEYGYDFDSDFWTDEQHTMMQEIIEATESELKKLRVADVIQQSEQFFCCVVENGQPKCEKQCQFCKDWVDDAEEQKNCI